MVSVGTNGCSGEAVPESGIAADLCQVADWGPQECEVQSEN